MKRRMLIIGSLAVVLGMSYVFSDCLLASSEKKKKLLRVGVYDSRAIRMAYTFSPFNDNFMQKKSRGKKEAEAKGDAKKAQELEDQMQRYALKAHKQVFSTTPVKDLLKLVEKKLPEIAKQAGVDMIVSKWQIDYLTHDSEVVDVTFAVAKAFGPAPDVFDKIQGLIKKAPLSEKEVELAEKKCPH